MAEDYSNAALLVDVGKPIANDPSPDGRRALRVNVMSATAPAEYNNGIASFPDSVTEIYTFKKDATVLKTVTLVYATPEKDADFTWSIT